MNIKTLVVAALTAIRMHRDAPKGAEDLDRRGGGAHLDDGAHEAVGYAVVVAVEFDVVVDVHAGGLEARDRHASRRQGPQRRPIQDLEGAGPAAGQLLEGTGVQIDQ